MNINQLSISYSEAQDRIMFSITGAEQEQIILALTRRFLKALWPMLVKGFITKQTGTTNDGVTMGGDDAMAQKAMLDFRHQQQISQGQYQQPPIQGKSFPAGEAPLLVTGCKLTPGEPSHIEFNTVDGKNIGLKMNDALLHQFCYLLQQIEPKTGWGTQLGGLMSEPTPSIENVVRH